MLAPKQIAPPCAPTAQVWVLRPAGSGQGVPTRKVETGWDRSGQVGTGQERLGKVKTGEDRSGEHRSGERTGQDRSGQVRKKIKRAAEYVYVAGLVSLNILGEDSMLTGLGRVSTAMLHEPTQW